MSSPVSFSLKGSEYKTIEQKYNNNSLEASITIQNTKDASQSFYQLNLKRGSVLKINSSSPRSPRQALDAKITYSIELMFRDKNLLTGFNKLIVSKDVLRTESKIKPIKTETTLQFECDSFELFEKMNFLFKDISFSNQEDKKKFNLALEGMNSDRSKAPTDYVRVF